LELAVLECGPEPVESGLGALTDGRDLAEVEYLAQYERPLFLLAAEQVGELVLREQDGRLEAEVGQVGQCPDPGVDLVSHGDGLEGRIPRTPELLGRWRVLATASAALDAPLDAVELEGESDDHGSLAVGDQLFDVTLRPRRRPEQRIAHRFQQRTLTCAGV